MARHIPEIDELERERVKGVKILIIKERELTSHTEGGMNVRNGDSASLRQRESIDLGTNPLGLDTLPYEGGLAEEKIARSVVRVAQAATEWGKTRLHALRTELANLKTPPQK